ncbi:hypothetical protein YC2023_032780 [Brassica napus]
MSPSVETSTQFVYNSSLPSTPSSFSDLFVDNVVATSSDSLDLSQRSRGDRTAFPHDIMSCEGDREFVFDLNNTPPNSFEASNGNSGSSVADLAKQE